MTGEVLFSDRSRLVESLHETARLFDELIARHPGGRVGISSICPGGYDGTNGESIGSVFRAVEPGEVVAQHPVGLSSLADAEQFVVDRELEVFHAASIRRAISVGFMIPSTWTEYRREDDGELLGYLVPEGDLHAPVTVFGYRLGDAEDEYDAGQVLEGVGLSYLADRWLLSLEDREEPINVQIVEASPERLRVKSVDYGYEEDYGTIFELPVPEQGRLQR